MRRELCSTCVETGRRGYCAPLRCYCAHEGCPAYASWRPLRELNVVSLPTPPDSSAWDERDGTGWLDKM